MKVKVLIADDAATVRAVTKSMLKQSFPNIIVEEAVNGKEAQHLLEQFHYDLVISDWEMPEMSGDELLLWMKKTPGLKNIPFIMVSARNDAESVKKAIELGANSFIVKPYTAEILTQRIVAVVGGFDRRENERFHIDGSVTIHAENCAASDPIPGKITDISMLGMQGVFSGKNLILPVLGSVTLDIKLQGGFVLNGLEAFIVRMQAGENAKEVKIAFKNNIPADKQQKLKVFLKDLALLS